MTERKTAREVLAWIEKKFFKGAGLAKASKLEGEERRAYVLSQVDRLLSDKRGLSVMAMLLSDQFWTAEEGRVPMPWEDTPVIPEPGYLTNPLLSLKEQQTLTDREMSRLRLILEIAGLCHDLSLHFVFDLKEAFGVKNDLWVSNKQLVEWLSTTEYENIAMHTAYLLRKHAINVYYCGHYQPAQDAMAELFSSEYHELVREPNTTDMPPRGYVKTILDELLRIERHWQRGRRLKLRPELIILHDEIYGLVPRQFDKGVLAAAQALYDYMDTELCGRLVLEDYDYNATSWSEQPESVRRITAEVLNRFAAKVREVRAQYLAEGWIADGSLEFAYLMAHAENCGYGIWREEDDAL
jgi:hypothetical protein